MSIRLSAVYHPVRDDPDCMFRYMPHEPLPRKLKGDDYTILKLLSDAHRYYYSLSDSFKRVFKESINNAYWSVLTFNDYILINVLDERVKTSIGGDGYEIVSDTTRVIHINISDEVVLQVVDERVKHYGSSHTIRSIRLVRGEIPDLASFHAYTQSKPYNKGRLPPPREIITPDGHVMKIL